MKYYNLVFINHGNSSKNYLFKVHLKVSLKKGEKVFVKTPKGECIATTASDSFIVDNYTACRDCWNREIKEREEE